MEMEKSMKIVRRPEETMTEFIERGLMAINEMNEISEK